jgi:hypothetical protein
MHTMWYKARRQKTTQAPLEVREHARGVSGNPGFSRKEPGGLGCLILIITRACGDFQETEASSFQVASYSTYEREREKGFLIAGRCETHHAARSEFIRSVLPDIL